VFIIDINSVGVVIFLEAISKTSFALQKDLLKTYFVAKSVAQLRLSGLVGPTGASFLRLI